MKTRVLRFGTYIMTMAMLFSGLVMINEWGVETASGANAFHRGGTSGDEAWQGGDVHYVDDEFNVSSGHTLTIWEGATVLIDASDGNGSIVVKSGGKLVMNGTVNNPIMVDSNLSSPSPGSYQGIIVESGGIAYINHTLIENAIIGVDITDGDTELNDCVINETSEWGVEFSGSGSPVIFNCTINNTGDGGNNEGAIKISSNGNVIGCEIFNATSTGIYISGGQAVIRDTRIHNTTGNGIRFHVGSTPTIINCNVSNTWKENIYITGSTRSIIIDNSTVGNWTNPGAGDTIDMNTDATHIINLTLLNCSFKNDTFNVGNYGNLSINYFVKTTVVTSNNDGIPGATVKMLNKTAQERFTRTTGAQGVAWVQGIHFTYNGSYWFDRDYTINVTHVDYDSAEQGISVDQFNAPTISLTDPLSPVLSRVSPPMGVNYIGGESFTFKENMSDNGSGVNDTTVEFWYQFEDYDDWYVALYGQSGNDSAPTRVNAGNWSKTGITYEIIMNLTGYPLEKKINFTWRAADYDGNYQMDPGPDLNTNYSVIYDNQSPSFVINNTPMIATTGDPFTFSANFTDNVNIQSAYVNYTYGDNVRYNDSMTNVAGEMWNLTVTVQSNATDILYFFYFVDPAGNNNTTAQGNVTVNDNDAPQVLANNTPNYGTTGDEFIFSANITDNVFLTDVYVNYTYDNISYFNDTMVNEANDVYNKTISIGNNLTVMYYFFYLNDLSNNSNITPLSRVPINDNDEPMLQDLTPPSGSTNDSFIFNASVQDNLDSAGELNVRVLYWYGNEAPQNGTNATLTNTHNTSYFTRNITLPANSNASLHYNISSVDSSGNWNETGISNVSVLDNDLPVNNGTNTPAVGYTGDAFVFNCSWKDNIEIFKAWVEYWYGNGNHTNVSMVNVGGDSFEHTIQLRNDFTGTLNYNFSANDTEGNWEQILLLNSSILDNDRPIFGQDSTPNSGVCGGNLTFNISVTDNMNLSTVKVNYTIGNYSYNVSLNGANPYTKTVTLPLDADGTLSYYFWTNDTSGNTNVTSPVQVTVTDQILPRLVNNSVPNNGYTGEELIFNCSWSDNININGVFVEYWYGAGGGHTNLSMNLANGYYVRTITLRNDFVGILNYIISAVDDQGNWNSTGNQSVNIADDELPAFGTDNTPGWSVTGGQLNFTIAATDNVGVMEVRVRYYFVGMGGIPVNISMKGSGPYFYEINLSMNASGILNYTFLIKDLAGNWNNTANRSVRIYDNQHPVFGYDESTGSANTGNMFNFDISIYDNVEVNKSTVEYWYGANGQHINNSLNAPNPYNRTITLRNDFAGTFYFYFSAKDGEGNWTRTTVKTREIIDDEMPSAVDMNKNLTTGDVFNVSIQANDNIRVAFVHYYYKFIYTNEMEDKSFSFVVLEKVSGNSPEEAETWNNTLQIPGAAAFIHVFYHISDGTNGPYFNKGGQAFDRASAEDDAYAFNVTDNDLPELVEKPTFDNIYYTGDEIDILVKVSDNTFMINNVSITFSGIYADKGTILLNMMYPGAMYNLTIKADLDRVGRVDFNININDRAGNSLSVPNGWYFNFSVNDSIAPVVVDVTGNVTRGTNNDFTIQCWATDNVGLTDATLHIKKGEGGEWMEFEMEYSAGEGSFHLSYPIPLYNDYGIDTTDGTSLYYYIFIYDAAGNMDPLGSKGIPYVITFVDDDVPEVTSNFLGNIDVGTGDGFTIRLNATDNIGLNNTLIYIKQEGVEGWSEPIELYSEISGDGRSGFFYTNYTHMLGILGNGISTLNGSNLTYYLEILDVNGQFLRLGDYKITVNDTMDPHVVGDAAFSPDPPKTQQEMTISVMAVDNVDDPDKLEITLIYEFKPSYLPDPIIDSMIWDDGSFHTNVNVPENAMEMLYYFNISDTKGNFNLSVIKSVSIKDIIAPKLNEIRLNNTEIELKEPTSPTRIYAGEEITVTIKREDNVDASSLLGARLEYTNVSDNRNDTNFVNSASFHGAEAILFMENFSQGYGWFRIILNDTKGNNFTSPAYLLNVSTNDLDGDGTPNGDEPQWESLNPNGSSKGGANGTLFLNDSAEWMDTDGDGVGDNSDKLLEDPSAAMDTDGDRLPDEWLPGKTQKNSTRWVLLFQLAKRYDEYLKNGSLDSGLKNEFEDHGLELGLQASMYPFSDGDGWKITDDDDEYKVTNTSGMVNVYGKLYLDAFPNDSAASVDTDGDGAPDYWNQGKSEEDSTTGLKLDYDPNDPEIVTAPPPDFRDEHTKDLNKFLLIALIIIGLIFLLLIIFLIVKKREKDKKEGKGKDKKDKKEKAKKEEKEKKEEKKLEKRKKRGKKEETMGPGAELAEEKTEEESEKPEEPELEGEPEPEEEKATEEPVRRKRKKIILDDDEPEEALDIDEMLPEELLKKEEKTKKVKPRKKKVKEPEPEIPPWGVTEEEVIPEEPPEPIAVEEPEPEEIPEEPEEEELDFDLLDLDLGVSDDLDIGIDDIELEDEEEPEMQFELGDDDEFAISEDDIEIMLGDGEGEDERADEVREWVSQQVGDEEDEDEEVEEGE